MPSADRPCTAAQRMAPARTTAGRTAHARPQPARRADTRPAPAALTAAAWPPRARPLGARRAHGCSLARHAHGRRARLPAALPTATLAFRPRESQPPDACPFAHGAPTRPTPVAVAALAPRLPAWPPDAPSAHLAARRPACPARRRNTHTPKQPN
ncbi:histone H1-like [Phragmites australis]|uniref:histone H1-like n=1 Tax=Phragmites australis TaxID=29695 RepID=UPI002D76731D|nr:histone H1-like [Phragmites australis]